MISPRLGTEANGVVCINKKILISIGIALLIGGGSVALSQFSEVLAMKKLGLDNGLFQACPNRENCRNSDDPQEKFQIAAIADSSGEKWLRLVDVLSSMPRTKLVSQSESYLHFTQASKLMRFVDDIEFYNRPEVGEIAVRSASRLGYRDFGVNMQRIELVRALLEGNII